MNKKRNKPYEVPGEIPLFPPEPAKKVKIN
jgi:hypothetical protein